MVLGVSLTAGSSKHHRNRWRSTSRCSVLSQCRIDVDAEGNVEVFVIPITSGKAHAKSLHVSLDQTYLSSSEDDTNSAGASLNAPRTSATSLEYSDSENTTEEKNNASSCSNIVPPNALCLSASPSHPSSTFDPDATDRANATPPHQNDSQDDKNDDNTGHDTEQGESSEETSQPSIQDTDSAIPVKAISEDNGNSLLLLEQQQLVAPLHLPALEQHDAPKKLDAQAFLRTLLLLAFWVGQLKTATYIHNLAMNEH